MERFLLFVALGGGMAFGQAADAAGIVTGRVVDATTKEGIRKATVYATAEASTPPQAGVVDFKPPTTVSTVTDGEGVFRMTGMRPGRYRLRAEKTGYLEGYWSKRVNVRAEAGRETAADPVVMARQAVIAGRVTDADGEPVEQANVQVIPVRRSGPTYAAATDDRGEFRVPRLEPGTYVVLAAKPPSRSVANTPVNGEPLMVNAPTYFPSVIDEASAGRFRMGPGEERTNVEIRLQKTVTVRVAGRLEGDLPANMPVFLSLLPMGSAGNRRSTAFNTWGAIAGTDRQFVFHGVTPGEYVVTGNLQRPGGTQTLSGMTRVRVGQLDVDDVTLLLQPPVRITGRAVAEGGAKLAFEQILIGLRSAEPGIPGEGGAKVKADGTFVLENLPRTRLVPTGMAPKGWYLKSLSVAGQRQPRLEFEASGAETVVEFVYSNRPGAVEVSIEGTGEEGVTWVAAALPEAGNGPPALTNLYSVAVSGPGGKVVKIEGVAPGNYQIVVCPQRALQLLGEREIWELVKEKAVGVKVEEGGTVSAAVRLITESDFDEK
jgi:hypothetical protein